MRHLCQALAVLAISVPAFGAKASWLLDTRDGKCLAEKLIPITDTGGRDRLADKLSKRIEENSDEFALKVRKAGGFITNGVVYDFSAVRSILRTDINGGSRNTNQEYSVQVEAAEPFKISDNVSGLFACPASTANPSNGVLPDTCVNVWQLRFTCENLESGKKSLTHVVFDSNGNGARLPNSTQLVKLTRLEQDEAASLRVQHEARHQVLQQEARREQARKEEMTERARRQNAENQVRQLAVLNSKVGTSIFCSSGDWLLMPGSSMGRLVVRCNDLPNPLSIQELINKGWQIVNQVALPQTSVGGEVGASISFQATKVR